MRRRRGLCCTPHKRMISIDFDEQNRVTTYDGLERCIKQSQSCDDGNESSASRSVTTDSSLFDDDASSSSSNTSSNNTAFQSSSLLTSSDWTAATPIMKREPEMCEFSAIPSPQQPHTYAKEKVTECLVVVEAMKVKFSKLLLGEDMTGGSNGISTALALSNAILNLSTSVFGELQKLEPLSEEKKRIWQQEMEWFLSPTNYMVELVPSTQNGDNGCIYEIMTPKARPDVQMNLPALQKLDTMLIETLDSMVNTEFWYSEVGSSRAEGRSKRWGFPSPQVPKRGLCDGERKKLMDTGKLVNQILKASKAINENVLLEMTVPAFIRDAIPKSAKANLGEDLYQILTRERVGTFDDMVESLNLKTEHNALETINRLEAAILVWKEKMAEEAEGVPMFWSSFIKHPKTVEVVDVINVSLNHAEALLWKIRTRYPNLPHTFLDMMKIQYGKDIGHAILEAYSRVLGNLAYTILTRIGAILQEDILSNPNSPAKGLHLHAGATVGTNVRSHSLIDQMNKHAPFSSCGTNASDLEMEEEINSTRGLITSSTPSRTRVWCPSREVCRSKSTKNLP